MSYNYEYPYVDPNRYNSDWMLNEIKTVNDRVAVIDEKLPKYVQDYLDGKYPLAISFDTMNPDKTGQVDVWPLLKQLVDNGYKIIALSAGTYVLRVNETVSGITFIGNSPDDTEIVFPGDRTNRVFDRCNFINLKIGIHEALYTKQAFFNRCNVYHYDPTNYTILVENHHGAIHFENSKMTGYAVDSTHIGTMFGIWSDNTSNTENSVICKNSTFDHFVLNAVFGGTGNYLIDDCIFTNCHTQTTPTGGGCVDAKGGLMLVRGCQFSEPGGTSTAGIESEKCRVIAIGNYFADIPVALAIQGNVAGNIFSGNYVHETITINSDSEIVITGNYFENAKVLTIPKGSENQFVTYTGNSTIGNFGFYSNRVYYIRECQMVPAFIASDETITINVPYAVTLTLLSKNNGVMVKYLICNGNKTLLYGTELPNNAVTVDNNKITIASTINAFIEIGINN